ncbi:hypothetical protein DYB34_003537 [Aphanomyces astaci]|uniref:Uncharacterized protein n=1 Tax=Aphanomyces astaci TaxID=112090 RepID=A0A3R6W6M0_APHAT|nr:hypothetical protein DYB34_003537 [Aphanomyces astaci]
MEQQRPLLSRTASLSDSCPEKKGCLSSMLFTWMNPLMDLGNRRPLEMDDLFQLNPDLRADAASARFSACWDMELQKASPSLASALFRAFGAKFVAAGVLRFVRDALQFIGPFVLQRVIAFLLTPDAALSDGLVYVALIFVGGIFQSFCFRNYMYFVFETGLLFRSAIVTAVYRKSLVLSAGAMAGRSVGEITNLMSIDAQRLQDLLGDLHAIWYKFTLFISSFTVVVAVVAAFRTDELRQLTSYLLARTASTSLFNGVPSLVTIATFTTYVVLGHSMDTSTALTSLSLFAIMRFPLFVLPTVINAIVEASVSFQRLQAFLLEAERTPVGSGALEATGILLERAAFSWEQPVLPKRRASALDDTVSDVSFQMQTQGICAVVGGVGSGKSTLLSGLLGDAPCTQGTVSMRGSVAYVSQQPFIQNATLRDNICFGLPYEYGRYTAAVGVCCLEADLRVLPGGDLTEIGERGINLSGGQRTRVALARAVYQDADIYLLDDVLAAVDAHVGATIFRECIRGFLGGKIVVMVTNNLQVLPQCDSVLVLSQGRVVEHDSFAHLVQIPDGYLAGMVANFKESDAPESQTEDNEPNDDEFGTTPGHALVRVPSSEVADKACSLMAGEDRSTGDVPWSVFAIWIQACGGPYVAGRVLAVFVLAQATNIAATLWLSYWSDQDQRLDVRSHRQGLFVFIGLNFAFALLIYLRVLGLYLAGLQASRALFSAMFTQVLRAPMHFFDTTPLGRIINRMSKDMYAVDEDIPSTWANVLSTLCSVAATLATIVVVTPWFVTALVPLVCFYAASQRFFVKTSRELQRLESISRSPIYALTAETLDGLPTIRAYKVERSFQKRYMDLLDCNQRAYFLNFSANCWLGLRLEVSGAMVASFATLFVVLNHSRTSAAFAGLAGVSLTYAFSVTPALNMSVRYLSQLQTQMVSVERVQAYAAMPTERPLRSLVPPPPQWPQNGRIVFESVDLRYRVGMPRVLRNLCCTIHGGEKVGVVGRTGAGKSSLVVALMRLAEVHGGRITLDDVDISAIGLHDLREKISIIPQDSVLFSGTLRSNVDPFHMYNDEALWAALKRVQMPATSLDDVVDGGNFSVGERQLMCIARALLKRSRVILMDEATASVDPDTDRSVQRSLREVFCDCTCITIAHRLHTIMDSDRILVMDGGSAVEFDTPKNLLKRRASLFASLVAHSQTS